MRVFGVLFTPGAALFLGAVVFVMLFAVVYYLGEGHDA